MKEFLKSIFATLLAVLARLVIAKYKPKVLMVTGSVGKTSTKDAISVALSYNNEFGVPITIFRVDKPVLTPLGYLLILKNALGLILLPNHYPNLLVLEVGADRPGDMAKILRIAHPDIVVVTRLPEVPVHVEAYATPAAVREEEFAPATALPAGAPLIVSADDPYALELARGVPARLVTFGEAEGADVLISNLGFCEEGGVVVGMCARVKTETGEEGKLLVKGSVGYQQILPAAAAVAAALALHVSLPDTLKALEAYDPPAGRGRIFRGKKGSVLIDDTYNASPAAVEEALKTLNEFPGAKRRIAVLGDMLELGRYSVAQHERIGEYARTNADLVVSVGIRARSMAADHSFNDAAGAASMLEHLIEEGDVLLIKGSQGVRMESIVEHLLASHSDSHRLVRQEKEWKRR